MANVINLPTYEQTEEIRQNVEDIGTLVTDTSGVFIGTDGKKYKAIFEEGYRAAEIVQNKISNSLPLIHLDSVIIGHSTTDLMIYDRTTLQYIVTIFRYNSNYTYGISGYGITHNVAEDNDYIYVLLRNSGGGYALEVISKTTWQRVGLPKETPINHNSVASLTLYSGTDRLYMVHVGANKVNDITTNYSYVLKSDLLALNSLSTVIVHRAASVVNRGVTSVNEVGNHIYVVEKQINNSTGYIFKYDKNFNLIAQTSSFGSISAALGEVNIIVDYSDNVITYLTTLGGHIELNTQTMTVISSKGPGTTHVFRYDAQSKEIYTSIASYDNFYFAKHGVIPISPATNEPKAIYKVVPPRERIDKANKIFPFIHSTTGEYYLIENSGAYNTYKLEAINVIAGYKEVL